VVVVVVVVVVKQHRCGHVCIPSACIIFLFAFVEGMHRFGANL
jgi:hypothetical protein